MNNNSNKKREKIITFILGALLIIVVLAIIAIFSGAIMRLLLSLIHIFGQIISKLSTTSKTMSLTCVTRVLAIFLFIAARCV